MLIDGKNFFDVPVKNKEEAYEKIMSIKMVTQLVIYWTDKYILDHYKLIAIALSKTFEFSQNSVSFK